MILHASAIFPASHPRLFYKIACSSSEKSYVLALPPLPLTCPKNMEIRLLPQGNLFQKLNVILLQIKKIKPKILHIHSPEVLLLLPFLPKEIQIVYDVYEDYLTNRKFSPVYAKHRKKHILQGKIIRILENSQTKQRIRFVVYAEKSYVNFLGASAYEVLENRFIDVTPQIPVENPDTKFFHIVYAGTLAKNWGVFKTLEVAKQIRKHIPVKLTFVGYAPRKSVYQELQKLVSEESFPVKIVGGNRFVPYESLQAVMKTADLGTALYIPDKSIEQKFPTKFYEWSALQIPFLFTGTSYWKQIMKTNTNAFPFTEINGEMIKSLLFAMQNKQKLPLNILKLYLWKPEKITNLYKQLL